MSLSQNLPRNKKYNVESVECVENEVFPLNSSGSKTNCKAIEPSTKSSNAAVESVASSGLAEYFSTLSTKLQKAAVENIPAATVLIPSDLQEIPRIPQVPQMKNTEPVESQNLPKKSSALILEWLQIALREGHIEPSQPAVGKVVGWPRRKVFSSSLFMDFTFWCRKQGVSDWQMPTNEQFCALVDQLLCREGTYYNLPPLPSCRLTMVKFMEAYATA